MGIAGCSQCTKADSTAGAATCNTCQDGFYKDGNVCTPCTGTCATCSGSGASACTSCPEGKYLKNSQCIDKTGCTNNHYPDPISRKCISCSAATSEGGIEGCATCEYDSTKGKPKCLTCSNSGGDKIPRTTLDGTSTCILKST